MQYYELDQLQVTKILAEKKGDKNRNIKVLFRRWFLDLILCIFGFGCCLGICYKLFGMTGDFKYWFLAIYVFMFLVLFEEDFRKYLDAKRNH